MCIRDRVGVGTRQPDQWAAGTTLHTDDITAQSLSVPVLLPRDLLCAGELALDGAEVDQHGAWVAGLLDHTGDDLALLVPEVTKDRVVLELAHPLQDHLAGGRRGYPPETLRRVIELRSRLA